MVTLRAEVEALEDDLNQMKSNPNYLPTKIQDLQRKLSLLRDELHEIEKKSDALSDEHAELRRREEERFRAEVKRLLVKIEERSSEKLQRQSENQRRERDLDEEYQVSHVITKFAEVVLDLSLLSHRRRN